MISFRFPHLTARSVNVTILAIAIFLAAVAVVHSYSVGLKLFKEQAYISFVAVMIAYGHQGGDLNSYLDRMRQQGALSIDGVAPYSVMVTGMKESFIAGVGPTSRFTAPASNHIIDFEIGDLATGHWQVSYSHPTVASLIERGLEVNSSYTLFGVLVFVVLAAIALRLLIVMNAASRFARLIDVDKSGALDHATLGRYSSALEADIAQMAERVTAALIQRNSQIRSHTIRRLSHDIRSQLQLIQTLLDSSKTLEPAAVASAVRSFSHAVERLTVDASTMSSQEISICKAHVLTIPLVDRTLVPHRRTAEQRRVVLLEEVNLSVPSEVVIDHARYQQVVDNLIRNAFDAVGLYKSVTVRVTVISSSTSTKLLTIVSDNGVGFDVAEVMRMVRSSTHDGASVGGLTLAASIVRALGGRLRVWSKPQVGSTIAFTVDLDVASERVAAPVGHAFPVTVESPVPTHYKSFRYALRSVGGVVTPTQVFGRSPAAAGSLHALVVSHSLTRVYAPHLQLTANSFLLASWQIACAQWHLSSRINYAAGVPRVVLFGLSDAVYPAVVTAAKVLGAHITDCTTEQEFALAAPGATALLLMSSDSTRAQYAIRASVAHGNRPRLIGVRPYYVLDPIDVAPIFDAVINPFGSPSELGVLLGATMESSSTQSNMRLLQRRLSCVTDIRRDGVRRALTTIS